MALRNFLDFLNMIKDSVMGNWLKDIELNNPLVIAGPCSAETETQLLTTAKALKNTGVSIFRAGIWKPRTRPGNFEGVGAIGLKWLQKVKEETNMLIATEVANRTHVELALAHDVDVFWVGARTTVSPFMVQELAEALSGTDKIVLVKNPVNPDLGLWIGAIERFLAKGVNKIGAIHRGFSAYQKTEYRNNPEWQIPIALQNEFPDLPLICDASHICGQRNILQDVSQTALDLNFDGLMIETHFDPDNAWSDSKQQITPSSLLTMIDEIKVKKLNDSDDLFQESLVKLRSQINVMDDQLLQIFGKRMEVAKQIGVLKKERNVAILQTDRWNEILTKMILLGEEKKLSKEFITKIFKAIHQESINHQKCCG